MSMTEKIRIILVKRGNMSEAELSRRLNTTPQNLNKKLTKGNLREEDLQKIAEALDCTFEGTFRLNDTGEQI